MSRYVSDRNQVGLFYESGTYAVASGVLHSLGLVQSHEPTENINLIPVRYLGNNSRNVGQFNDGVLDYTGTITTHPQDFKMFLFALGSCADTWGGSPTGPKTHTFIEVTSADLNNLTSGALNPFVSFGLEDSWGAPGTNQAFTRTIKGATINTLKLGVADGELATLEAEYVAQSSTYTSGTATTITGSTTTQQATLRPFLYRDLILRIPSGTVIDEVKEVSFEVMNNLDAPHYLNGSRGIAAPIPLNRDYRCTVTLAATSERMGTLWHNYFQNGSPEFNALLDMTIVAGSRDLRITMSGCKAESMDDPSRLEGQNEVTFTFRPKNCTIVARDDFLAYNPW